MPVWAIFEEGQFVFMTGDGTRKAKNMRRDARVSLAYDREEFPYDFATVVGTAEVKALPMDELLEISRRIASRFVPAEQVEAFAKRNAVPEEVVVVVTPTRVISARGVSD